MLVLDKVLVPTNGVARLSCAYPIPVARHSTLNYRPPIQKLWRWLAKGRSFPTCSGVGFQSSRPRYEPYYCNDGYRLSAGYGPTARDGACVSTSMQPVNDSLCRWDRDNAGGSNGSVISPRWQQTDGRYQCIAYTISRPLVREKPRYIEVTIHGVGKQRVWF